jgi:TM2 domain-containing membrane protein YozV
MVSKWSEKIVKYSHFIRICYKRIWIAIAVLIFGTGLLSIYSLINFVNSMAASAKGNPGVISAVFIILIAIPLAAYGVEKGLSSYLRHK